uniref:Cytochrome c biogenesis protein CcsA n=1 Tax=Chlorokybus atmophyticus TaxID=3144 RepID=A2CI72_CHLAT|nr:cytochrome c biogenesis protein [Chlorokybus atmophyticus]ABM87950.1 heme attachment to plastid cytochrome c [Chlorokybus atmophyticus]WKT05622.1 cytochrome c biogenesis protein [Chlorokybus atmophyticus]
MTMLDIEGHLGNLSFGVLLITLVINWGGALAFSGHKLTRLGNLGILTSNLAIGGLLCIRWISSNHFPLSNLYESLMFLSWGLTALHLVLERSSKIPFLGAITAPSALFINAFATLSLPADMQKAGPLVPALKSNWLMMHVSIMMLSYAALICGSLLSITFLVLTNGKEIDLQGSSLGSTLYQQWTSNKEIFLSMEGPKEGEALKLDKRDLDENATVFDNLESLQLAKNVDNLSYRTLGIGFPLLTLGIISGAVWANEAWGSYWSWDPKETWALITWFVFAIYLHTRITRGWQGKKPAIVASLGFVIVWVCYLGVNLLGKGLHSYGWWIQS